MSQAGPGNDINAGSPGSQKAPTQIPASLVQPLACALWRRLPHPSPEGDMRQDQARAGGRGSTTAAEALYPAAGECGEEKAPALGYPTVTGSRGPSRVCNGWFTDIRWHPLERQGCTDCSHSSVASVRRGSRRNGSWHDAALIPNSSRTGTSRRFSNEALRARGASLSSMLASGPPRKSQRAGEGSRPLVNVPTCQTSAKI